MPNIALFLAAFQAAILVLAVPRALPWAVAVLAFQAKNGTPHPRFSLKQYENN